MLMDMASPPFGGYGRPPTVLCSALFYSRPVPGAKIILPYVTISVKQFSLPGRPDPPRAKALGGSLLSYRKATYAKVLVLFRRG